MTNGFLYVATRDHIYYKLALYSMESLRDHYPDANICFVTHPEWVTPRARQLVDHLITEDVPNERRAKLWALNKTPFDFTCYIDVDTEIEHTDIRYIFDELNPDSDIAFTEIRPYGVAITELPDGVLKYHCGIFVYRGTQKVLDFLWEWRVRYMQFYEKWLPGKSYPRDPLRFFDTFTMWWLLNKEEYGETIRVNTMDDDARWNLIWSWDDNEAEKPVVVRHTRVFK